MTALAAGLPTALQEQLAIAIDMEGADGDCPSPISPVRIRQDLIQVTALIQRYGDAVKETDRRLPWAIRAQVDEILQDCEKEMMKIGQAYGLNLIGPTLLAALQELETALPNKLPDPKKGK